MWGEREVSQEMMPIFLAWASGRRELLFTEIGQAVGRVGFRGEDQEFSFEIPVRQPNGEVK